MDRTRSITPDAIAAAHESFIGCRSNQIARNAVAASGIAAAARNPQVAALGTTTFDIQL